ncbi:MAG: hypothetical protein ACI9DC_004242 [Gammaproteobacteria bacterium]
MFDQVAGVKTIRQQGLDAPAGFGPGQFSEHVAQVRTRFKAIGLCRADERVQIGAGVGAGGGITEQPVTPPDTERSDGVLDGIVVDGQSFIVVASDNLAER